MTRPAPTTLAAIALLLTGLVSVALTDESDEPKNSRDVLPENLAGNEEVERIIRTFAGRGEVGDDSDPTPAEEAVGLFHPAEGLDVELVAAEPVVEQPLFMHFDDRGRLWVVQYRQYPFPEGLKVIRYDQHLRAVFDKVPAPPPDHVRGRDRITVFEDTDGDGTYDAHKDVITGLNIATAVATGHGGIWVLNPPYLLFYPDADRDDVPDADPEVCLSGFGLEDTHSVANSLMWGPDGWLYGANGSTTTGNVSSAATRSVRWEGQNIWRYHPDSKVFEIFAEGGGNTFSLEIDGKGRVFSGTNNGNTRGMFYPQGSYGKKNWGKHGPLTNPFAFGHFEHMRHEGDRDRFAQTFVIYEGGRLPQRYQGNVIAANALHNRVWASELLADTSTYRTVDLPPVVQTPDHWFRPVCVKVGPDGAVYIADWYDTRLTHVDPRDNWHKTSGRIYRVVTGDAARGTEARGTEARGQVVSGEGQRAAVPSGDAAPKPTGRVPWVPADLTAMTDDELIDLFAHSNKWWRQTSVRVLGQRLEASLRNSGSSPGNDSAKPQAASAPRAESTIRLLGAMALDANDGRSLEALWTLHLAGRFDFDLAARLLRHDDEHVRRWTIRLLGDHRRLNDALGRQLAEMAAVEPYVQVRSQLASSAKRFDTRYALPIIAALVRRDEDQEDLHMPLLVWWALEQHCDDAEGVLALFESREFWDVPMVRDVILPRVMQRFAMQDVVDQPLPRPHIGVTLTAAHSPRTPGGLETCARLLELAPTSEHTARLMTGFLEAYQGREITRLPPALKSALEEYQQSLGESDLALALRLGDEDAVERALKTVGDESADTAARLAYLEILGQINAPRIVPKVLGLLGSSKSHAVKRAAMQTLMNYDDPKIGQTICSRYQTTLPAEHGLRATAHQVLASRPVWTKQFLEEITRFRIKQHTIPLDIVQQMRLHEDPEIQATLDRLWGRTRSTPAEKQQQVERLRSLIVGVPDPSDSGRTNAEEQTPDLRRGKGLFKEHCGTCHTLFGEGGQTGPDLTGYERTNLEFLLLAIVDPSAAIREEFTQFKVLTSDGRVLTGLIDDQTPTTVTLRGANNQTTLIDRDDIDILQAMDTSIMPDALMDKFNDTDIRDLFGYLMSRTPPQE